LETSFRKNSQEKISNAIKADIIIPTLNEESSIRKIIHSIRSHSFPINVSILVIDGGSTDKTVQICNEEKVKIVKQKGRGKGTAMREAVNVSNADIIIFIDGDGTYYVDDLEKLLEPLLNEKADMVVGSRLMGKREKGSISRMNIMGNKLFNRTINFAMNSRVTDSLSGYRAMRIETFTASLIAVPLPFPFCFIICTFSSLQISTVLSMEPPSITKIETWIGNECERIE